MPPSKNCYNLIKRFEGFRDKAYKDPIGILTVGYGHVIRSVEPILKSITLSPEQAELLLEQDLSIWMAYLPDICHKYDLKLNQNQYDALYSFCFNTGDFKPEMLKRFEVKDITAIGNSLLLYNKAGGKVVTGLTKRRQAEHDLFFKVI